MKKVMLMFLLATLAGASFAMDSEKTSDPVKQTHEKFETKSKKSAENDGPTDCTIAVRGEISLPGASFDITCTVTRSSCAEATRAARECVKTMMTALRRDAQF
jgi:uncharacterized membrane-anchored protein